ncbi:hypothetical protein [Actinomyces culturomici]|uniref:hypothetical protein n=1 Tax=Actinomyces culturomici TaxID=1926276 RepID=UPI000E209969|nr:hypothetical protein [Actinomyces culturomici]
MTPSLPCATIVDADGRRDVAVPRGTTVAGLMAMLRLDPEGALRLTGPDGRPLDPGAAIGADLPSGVVLALSDAPRTDTAGRPLPGSRTREPLSPALLGLLALSAIAILEAGALLAPLLGLVAAPTWARLAGPIAALGCGLVLVDRRARRSTPLLVVLSLLFGLAGLALVPLEAPSALPLAAVAVAWTALVGSLAAGLLLESPRCRAIAAAWTVVALGASLAVFTGARAALLAPLVLAAAVGLITASPSIAMRIPENQLLDLPAVATSAAGLRTPEPAAPSEITMPRIARTLSEARSRADVLVLACAGLLLAAAPVVYARIGLSDWEGRAALVLAICAPLVLLVDARARRERLGRALPRVLAAVLVVLALLSAPSLRALGPLVVAALLLVAGLGVALAGVASASSHGSALLGRIADVSRTLGLVLLVPAAVLASGLFDLARQAAS